MRRGRHAQGGRCERAAPPAASVVIPVYNGAVTLGAQLDAVTAQLDVVAFEVVVVDNNSTDASAEIAGRTPP